MNVKELPRRLDCQIAVAGDMDKEITGGYCGDLLSWVMGRCGAGNVWMTVIGNVNAVAVAVLADAACIVLCEDAQLDGEARKKAEENSVTVLTTGCASYEFAVRLSDLLKG